MKENVECKIIDNEQWFIKFKLPDEIVNTLWEYIELAEKKNIDHRHELAGNISRSLEMKDTDDIIINRLFDGLFNSDLRELFTHHIQKTFMKVFDKNTLMNRNLAAKLGKFWVNFQKKHEFNPLHDHSGLFSFVIWMKIPYNWEDEKELPWVKGSRSEQTVGNFVLVDRNLYNHVFLMNKDIEAHCVFFPSNLFHMVYPFYTSDEDRISVSGNIYFELQDLTK